MNKRPGPNVSVVRRFHCILLVVMENGDKLQNNILINILWYMPDLVHAHGGSNFSSMDKPQSNLPTGNKLPILLYLPSSHPLLLQLPSSLPSPSLPPPLPFPSLCLTLDIWIALLKPWIHPSYRTSHTCSGSAVWSWCCSVICVQ